MLCRAFVDASSDINACRFDEAIGALEQCVDSSRCAVCAVALLEIDHHPRGGRRRFDRGEYTPSYRRLKAIVDGDTAHILERVARDRANSTAMYIIGRRDRSQDISLFVEAGDRGCVPAYSEVDSLYANKNDKVTSVKYMLKGARLGDPLSLWMTIVSFTCYPDEMAQTATGNEASCEFWEAKAIDASNPDALHRLSLEYERGERGRDVDLEKAAQLFDRAVVINRRFGFLWEMTTSDPRRLALYARTALDHRCLYIVRCFATRLLCANNTGVFASVENAEAKGRRLNTLDRGQVYDTQHWAEYTEDADDCVKRIAVKIAEDMPDLSRVPLERVARYCFDTFTDYQDCWDMGWCQCVPMVRATNDLVIAGIRQAFERVARKVPENLDEQIDTLTLEWALSSFVKVERDDRVQ